LRVSLQRMSETLEPRPSAEAQKLWVDARRERAGELEMENVEANSDEG
jgi:hypothetical protein